jgi:hypothetical protein
MRARTEALTGLKGLAGTVKKERARPAYAGRSCTISADYSTGDRVPPETGPCRTNPFSIRRAPAGGSVKITVHVAAFTVGDVKYPAATVSKVCAGPALSTVVGHIGYPSTISYSRIDRSGFPVSVELPQARSHVGILLLEGKYLAGGANYVLNKAAGRVTLHVLVSPALGALVRQKGRVTLTLDVRVYPPGQAKVDVLKHVTFTRCPAWL